MAPSNRYKTSFRQALVISLSLLWTNTASAVAELQEKVLVENSVVTLSDIFTDTGEKGDITVMPSPAPGKRKQITSYDLSQIAKQFDLDWKRPAYLKRIYVHREGTHVSSADLKPVLLEKIREQGLDADISINIYGINKGFYLPLGYDVYSVDFEAFSITERQDRFTGTLKIPTGEHETNNVRISGTIQEVRLVPVLNRLVTPGEVISKADINWMKHPANRINRNAIIKASSLVGQTVKRALVAGKLLNQNDVAMPVMIEKGSSVSISLKSGLLTLTMKGRALDDGGKGDMIRVMNIKSHRSLEARIVSPGKVAVDPQPIIKVASR